MQEIIRCGVCHNPITQLRGGHRPRVYCSDTCKRQAYRMRQEEKRREAMRRRWRGYKPRTQQILESALRYHDLETVDLIVQALEAERTSRRSAVTIAPLISGERE